MALRRITKVLSHGPKALGPFVKVSDHTPMALEHSPGVTVGRFSAKTLNTCALARKGLESGLPKSFRTRQLPGCSSSPHLSRVALLIHRKILIP